MVLKAITRRRVGGWVVVKRVGGWVVVGHFYLPSPCGGAQGSRTWTGLIRIGFRK